MSKYFNLGLTLLSIFTTAFASLLLLELFGVRITDPVGFAAMAGWACLCLLTAYLRTRYYLFRHSTTRKPTWAEEERLQRCFGEVLQKAGYDKRCDLLIDERMDLNAFAIGTRTIAVSRGAMEQLSEEELKGLMAHELGHLASHDPIISATFYISTLLPRWVRRIALGTLRILVGRSKLRSRDIHVLSILGLILKRWYLIVICLLFLVVLVSLPGATPVITALAGLWAYILLFTGLDYLFGALRLLIFRLIEYEQDAFAYKLGYGAELRQVLYRATLEGPAPVNAFTNMTKDNHPIIYNRIRRLEKLEGLRGEARI